VPPSAVGLTVDFTQMESSEVKHYKSFTKESHGLTTRQLAALDRCPTSYFFHRIPIRPLCIYSYTNFPAQNPGARSRTITLQEFSLLGFIEHLGKLGVEVVEAEHEAMERAAKVVERERSAPIRIQIPAHFRHGRS
jgi:hypothetical protein